MFLLAVLAACSKQAGEMLPVNEKHSSEIIDHPAVVIFADSKQDLNLRTDEISAIKQLLAGGNIPVVTTNKENLEFVKQNGDRIKLNINYLPAKYNILIFDQVSNPVPCATPDFQKVFSSIFHVSAIPGKAVKTRQRNQRLLTKLFNSIEQPDTTTLQLQQNKVSKLRQMKFLVPASDSAYTANLSKALSGVIFIETFRDSRPALKLTFENDLITWNNTDRYYTNGIAIELQLPGLSRHSVSKLLLPYRHESMSSTSLLLVQNMYTSSDTRIPPTLKNDRPFASYIYLGIKRLNIDSKKKLRITNNLNAGVIGRYSPGSFLQTLVHKTFPTNDIPQGWETQISNDIIINYNYEAEKCLTETGKANLSAIALFNAGTLYNNAGIGLRAQYGISDSRFSYANPAKSAKWQAYVYAQAVGRFIAYDATLQGGMINRNNSYTLKPGQMNRIIGVAEAGLHFDYKGYGFEAAQHFLSPEFKQGFSHRWGEFSIILPL